MKIKLERWKEVVRLECKEDIFDTLDIEYLCRFSYHGGVIQYMDGVDEVQFKTNVEIYNNSIKDDGYNHLCTGCKCRCKVITIPNPNHNTNCATANNWEPIPNNKIEIIEGE